MKVRIEGKWISKDKIIQIVVREGAIYGLSEHGILYIASESVGNREVMPHWKWVIGSPDEPKKYEGFTNEPKVTP